MLSDLELAPMLTRCETDKERELVKACFTTRGKKRFRKSKPFKQVETPEQGYANYIWRMIAFDFAGCAPYNCLPVMADFDVYRGLSIETGFDGRFDDPGYQGFKDNERMKIKDLDELVKRVETAFPPEMMSGILQWGRALGRV